MEVAVLVAAAMEAVAMAEVDAAEEGQVVAAMEAVVTEAVALVGPEEEPREAVAMGLLSWKFDTARSSRPRPQCPVKH